MCREPYVFHGLANYKAYLFLTIPFSVLVVLISAFLCLPLSVGIYFRLGGGEVQVEVDLRVLYQISAGRVICPSRIKSTKYFVGALIIPTFMSVR
jgi:hypothetical protein